MDADLLDELRYACETQFRYMLYKDLKFKFMPALGMKNLIQGFSDPQTGKYIGVLHLEWKRDKNGECSYHSTWYDKAEDAIKLAVDIQEKKPYDEMVLMDSVIRHIRMIYGDPLEQNVLLS